MQNLAAIILAAGKGTRMKSAKPKVVFQLADKPLITRVAATAKEAKCSKIVAVVGYLKEEVMACLPVDLEYAEQKEQYGTGHAVMMTTEHFKNYEGDVFILCGDVPLLNSVTLTALYEQHKKTKACCTVVTALLEDPARYGRIIRENDGNISHIVEYKDASHEEREIREINTGIYCFDVRELFAALEKIDRNNAQNEYYLTDTLAILHKEGKKVDGYVLADIMEASGINSQKQLAALEDIFYARIKNQWLENGVQIENPATVIIGEEVVCGNDVFIGQNCIVKGKSELKTGVYLGPNCYLNNAVIAEHSKLEGYNIVINSALNSNLAFKEDKFGQ